MSLRAGAWVPLAEPPTPGRMAPHQMAAGLGLPVRQNPGMARAREPLTVAALHTRMVEGRFVAQSARTDQAAEAPRSLAVDRMEKRLRVVDFPPPRLDGHEPSCQQNLPPLPAQENIPKAGLIEAWLPAAAAPQPVRRNWGNSYCQAAGDSHTARSEN
jgi:hypothetical protein